MRPLELRLRNFRSYFGEDVTIDFRDRRLVGIVGPIGSGKSSILDAIAFALYGKTPAIASATKSLIHQRADGASVALRFEVEGQVWEVVRALRRKGQSQHALYRYESDEPDATEAEKITMEGDVNAKVVQLLGLDFDAFGRSVLLAQGRFAEFLRSRPGDRDKVLKGVFGHDRVSRMRDLAKTKAADLGVEVEKLSLHMSQLTDVRKRLAANEEQHATAQARLELLRKAEPALDDLSARIVSLRTAVESCARRSADFDKIATRLPTEAGIADLLAEARKASDEQAAHETTVKKAQADMARATAASETAETQGLSVAIEATAALLATVEPRRESAAAAKARATTAEQRVARTRAEVEASKARMKSATATVAAARATAKKATAAATKALDQFHRTQHANMALTLRADLSTAEPCPVCAQVVAKLPAAGAASKLDRHTSDLAAARAAEQDAISDLSVAEAELKAASEAATTLEAKLVVAQTDGDTALVELKAEDALLAESTAELGRLLGKGDPKKLSAGKRKQLEALNQAVATARGRLDEGRRGLEEAVAAGKGVETKLADLRVELAKSATLLESDPPDGSDPETLRSAAATLAATLSTKWASNLEEAKEAESGLSASLKEQQETLAEVGVSDTFDREVASMEATLSLLEKEVARDRDVVEEGSTLTKRWEATEAERGRFARISSDLTDSKFVRFLLDEERARLADLGSEHFTQLSAGRYRFTEDGTFNIVDLTAAEGIRKPESLSGGETFLASLALALALAEMVARTGGRLDAFFLDEGFGTLDPDHLDLAMEGIEALVSGSDSRLVVVVSHVPELRHRVEDLIELDRDPATGDTRVVRA